jgi:hypothetical protein
MEYMSQKKEVTIGITINLENYENLRLEVEGDVETQQDVDDLVAFLDGMLARLGRGDPATAERVDAYRRRVLTTRPETTEMETAIPPKKPPEEKQRELKEVSKQQERVTEPKGPQEEEKPCPTDTISSAIPPAPEHPHPPRIPRPPSVKEGEKQADIQEQPVPEQNVTPQSPPAQAEAVCEACGAGITKSQAKLSQLFMGKTLCKKCMEQP